MSKQINDLNKSLNQDCAKDSTVTTKVNEVKTEIGSLGSLKTTEKGSLVGAINELFQNANNGKQLIANAIGNSSITSNSTFSAMSEAINSLNTTKTNLTNQVNSLTTEKTNLTNQVNSLNTAKTNLTNQVNTLTSEKTNLTNQVNSLNTTINNTKSTLASLMQAGGYNITGSESIDSLLNTLKASGISVADIKQIACGYYHTAILKTDGTLWTCGFNFNGQLGLGDYANRNKFTKATTNVRQVACGYHHTVILKKDGTVWSCGDNYYGQLGLGNDSEKSTFTQATTNVSNVKQIVCGNDHTFILKTDGSIWGTGKNGFGQLGLGNNTDKTTFTKVTTNINNDVKQISCGVQFTFVVKHDGSLWSCGANDMGQLGIGSDDYDAHKTFTQVTMNINYDVRQVACGASYTFILKKNGGVWSCGGNYNGNLGLGSEDYNPHNLFKQVTGVNYDNEQIVCGDVHTVIIKSNGSIYSCGQNNVGQLGLNDTTGRSSFTKITTNINNDIKQVACGSYFTFIIKNDDNAWSCGDNSKGQLGLGDTTQRKTFTKVPK